jgi:hypothetical protein
MRRATLIHPETSRVIETFDFDRMEEVAAGSRSDHFYGFFIGNEQVGGFFLKDRIVKFENIGE